MESDFQKKRFTVVFFFLSLAEAFLRCWRSDGSLDLVTCSPSGKINGILKRTLSHIQTCVIFGNKRGYFVDSVSLYICVSKKGLQGGVPAIHY